MARGRPGGNPNIKEYGFKTDREHPLSEKITLRIDKPTRAAIKAGLLPDWSDIAREAIEKALAEREEEKLASSKENLKSA